MRLDFNDFFDQARNYAKCSLGGSILTIFGAQARNAPKWGSGGPISTIFDAQARNVPAEYMVASCRAAPEPIYWDPIILRKSPEQWGLIR